MTGKKNALVSIDQETVLEFRDEDEEAYFVTAVLGQEARDFFNTRLGKTIRAYAIQEIQTAQEALVNVDAADTKQILKLQMQANVPALFLSFVHDAITNGDQAEVALHEREAER